MYESLKYQTICYSYLEPVPKPDIDPSQLSSYRIITLENVHGKLLEKMVARNLVERLEDENILSNTLESYRQTKMT